MNWWQYLLIFYAVIFAIVFLRVSILVNRKRAELKVTRGLMTDGEGRPLTYARFLPTIFGTSAQWPITVLWNGLYHFLRDLM
jgi:hypothetical protein